MRTSTTAYTPTHTPGRARRRARTAFIVLAAAGALAAGAAGASGQPATQLPDALLVCDDVTFAPDQWVALPQADSLWISSGSMAGHYVILSATHYKVPGYLTDRPEVYDPRTMVSEKTHGAKTGLVGESVQCDFVSRWGEPGAAGTFSVVGPITIARVSG